MTLTRERADDIVVAYREAMGNYEKAKVAAHKAIVLSNEAAVVAQEATSKMKELMERVEITLTDAEVLNDVPTLPPATA